MDKNSWIKKTTDKNSWIKKQRIKTVSWFQHTVKKFHDCFVAQDRPKRRFSCNFEGNSTQKMAKRMQLRDTHVRKQ